MNRNVVFLCGLKSSCCWIFVIAFVTNHIRLILIYIWTLWFQQWRSVLLPPLVIVHNLPLIYSLIHLCCCHMVPLSLPPLPSLSPDPPLYFFIHLTQPPSPTPPSLPHLGPLSIYRYPCAPISPFLFFFLFPLFLPHSCSIATTPHPPNLLLRPPPPSLQFTPKVSQHRSSPSSAVDASLRVLCHANSTHEGAMGEEGRAGVGGHRGACL